MAREVYAFLRSLPFSFARFVFPDLFMYSCVAFSLLSGGKRPKFIFIGWKVLAWSSLVMWLISAQIAVVFCGVFNVCITC